MRAAVLALAILLPALSLDSAMTHLTAHAARQLR